MHRLLLALALIFPLRALADSPMFRGDAAHTGVYAPPAKPIAGKIAWSYEPITWEQYQALEDMDGTFIWPTTPAVVEGRIYFCAGPFFICLDEAGKPVYRVRLAGCSLASPAIADGLAFVPSDAGVLAALDVKNGDVRWTARIGGASQLRQIDNWDVYQSSPTVAGGVVYIGGVDGRIYAIEARDGAVKWSFATGRVVRATPAVADGRVFCGSFDGNVYALDAATGKQLWAVNTKTPGVPWNAVQGSCAVVDGRVYVGSRSAHFYAIDAADGKILWRHDAKGGWVPSSPAVRDGVAYVGQSDGNKVTALSADGHVQWSFDSPNETFASPALAGDVLYVAGNDNYNMRGKGSLSAVDIKTGKSLWNLELPASVWSSPVVVGDTIYLGCADGKLYAIK
ncbi:MAG TPA: PQQ-binding-like beta-propeller repeat protein [Opitutaceae bacterium]|nr:PQQ-binding-like beta-propeller repeat protein [Opitutaceae bacterium]